MSIIANAFVRFNAQDSGLFRRMMRIERGFGTMKSSYMKFAAATAGVALFGKAVKDAVDFEAELFNVRKTTNLTVDQVKRLGKEFVKLSNKTGVARKKLAEIGVVAGQLGIVSKAGGGEAGLKALEKFTEVVTKSRLAMPDFAGTAEEAATKVAKLLNIMNLTVDDTESLMSSINELSNTTAAGSDDIGEFMRRLGGTAIALGSTADKVAALSATLVEVGVNAELGGTAITRLLVKIQENLDDFTGALGSAGQQFKQAFVQDPIIGLQMLFDQMNRMNKEDQFKFMDDLSINSVRLIGVMNKLAQDRGIESLAKTIRNSNKAFNAGVSLQREFEIRLEATQSHVERLMTALGFVAQTLSEELFPVIKDLSLAVAEMFKSRDFQNNIKAVGKMLSGMFRLIGGGIKIMMEFREATLALGAAFLLVKLNAWVMPLQKIQILFGLGAASSLKAAVGVRTLAKGFRFLGTAIKTANKAYLAHAVLQGVQARTATGQFASGFATAFSVGGKGAGVFKTLGAAIKGALYWVLAFGKALMGLAAAHPVIATLLGIGAAITFIARSNRKLEAGLDRLRNFGEDFEFLKGFGVAGNEVIEQVDKVVKGIDSYKDALDKWFGVISKHPIRRGDIIQNIGLDYERIQKTKREVEKLREMIEKLQRIGKLEGGIFDALFEKKDDVWIMKQGEEAVKAMEKLKNAMEDYQQEAEKFVEVFENIRKNSPGLGIGEMLAEAEREFQKLGEKTEEQMDVLREKLIVTVAKNGEIGTAFGLAIAQGISAPEVKSMLKNASVTLTDVQLQAMKEKAEDAKEPATMLYAVYAQELISTEKARELFGMGEKLSVSVINGAQQEGLMNAMRAVGIDLGSELFEGLADAIKGGVKALEQHLGMSLSLDHPLRKYAAVEDAAKKIRESLSYSGAGDDDEAAAKKAQKEREERLKKILELEKKSLEVAKKRAELEKASIEAAAEGRDLTEEEERKLRDIRRILGYFPSHLYDINERIDGIVKSTEDWGKEWDDAKKRVSELRKELADLDKDMEQNREEFKRMYGEDPNKIGGEAALALAGEMGRKVAELEAERAEIDKKAGRGEYEEEDRRRREEINKEIMYLTDKYKSMGNAQLETTRAIEEQERKVFTLRAKDLIMQHKGHEAYKEYLKQLEIEEAKLRELRTPKAAPDVPSAFASGLKRGRDINEAETEAEKEHLKELFDIQDKRADMEKEYQRNVGITTQKIKEGEKVVQEEGKKVQHLYDMRDRRLERMQQRLEKLVETEKKLFMGGIGSTADTGFTDATQESAQGEDGLFSVDNTSAQNDEIENQQRITSRQQTLDQLLKLEQDHLANLATERTNAWTDMLGEMRENYGVIREETKALTDALIAMWNAVFSAMTRASGGAKGRSRTSGSGGGGGRRGGYADDFLRKYDIGGYTANVGIFKPAGVVHGGEWVAPNWMVKRFPGLISWLESLRLGKALKGYMNGGVVNLSPQSNVTKSNEIKVEMVNHIRDQLDMRAMAEQLGYSLGNRLLT